MTRSFSAAFVIGTVLFLTPAQAVSTPMPDTQVPGLELQAVERAIGRSHSRQQNLQKEFDSLQQENDDISQRLVDTASLIQAREAVITASEDKISTLAMEKEALRESLGVRNEQLSKLLAGLIELDQNPPPALVAQPHDALQAVRAAMVFGVAVPAVRAETANLVRDLARLEKLQTEIAFEKQGLTANVEKLRLTNLQLEQLLARKKELLQAAGSELQQERERAAALAAKARTLTELMKALSEDARRRDSAKAEAVRHSLPPDPEAIEKPRLAFTDSAGMLDFPAQGQVVRRYGDPDGFGGQSKGIFIATRPSAQVIAPSQSRVEFAGIFRSYGQLLILDVGEGYHVLLAGLGRVNVQTGQAVKAGEPVGEMGEAPAQGTMVGDQLSDPRPIVYVEFRKAGDAIDPAKWWIGGSKEARK